MMKTLENLQVNHGDLAVQLPYKNEFEKCVKECAEAYIDDGWLDEASAIMAHLYRRTGSIQEVMRLFEIKEEDIWVWIPEKEKDLLTSQTVCEECIQEMENGKDQADLFIQVALIDMGYILR